MTKYIVKGESLTAIADAIRAKTGVEDRLALSRMVDEINAITASDTTWEDALIERNFTEYTNDRVKHIGANSLRNNTAVTKYSFPSATTMGVYAFLGCTALVEVDLPLMTTISNRAFDGCTKITQLHFPSVTSIDHASLSAIAKLKLIIFDKIRSLNTSAFSGCSSLKEVVLKRNSLVSLLNVSAFTNTPFASGGTGGTVYVPQALIETYQTATNWSALYQGGTCTFVPLEGSVYE